jgi:hypothetical protein
MESERHAFMRKLLQLCVDSKLEIYASGESEVVLGCYNEDGQTVIENLKIDVVKKEAIGFWDGDEHRVWL